MINAWKQRGKKDGIVLKWVNFNYPIEDKSAIVEAYVQGNSQDKTRIVHITHVVNWNGIATCKGDRKMKPKRNIEVLVDAAHSFAHFLLIR